MVHTGVGGFLGNPVTAAFDPIFWLHHASIDHLWEVWLAQVDPARANPDDSDWLDTTFTFPDPEGRITIRVGDVLNIAEFGYVYDDVTPPEPEDRRGPVVTREFPTILVDEPFEPELIGASDDAVSLDPGATHAVNLQPPDQWRLSERGLETGAIEDRRDLETAGTELALGRRVLLQLEKVTGTQVPYGVYGVYVNVPEGDNAEDHPELKAGLFSPFGLELATAEGHGMTQAFDITEIARHLYEEGRWDAARVDVTFDAEVPVGEGEPAAGDVKAGSIRVYVE